jgi:hypothetical protein
MKDMSTGMETVYDDSKKGNRKWWQDLIVERREDIQTEMT